MVDLLAWMAGNALCRQGSRLSQLRLEASSPACRKRTYHHHRRARGAFLDLAQYQGFNTTECSQVGIWRNLCPVPTANVMASSLLPAAFQHHGLFQFRRLSVSVNALRIRVRGMEQVGAMGESQWHPCEAPIRR